MNNLIKEETIERLRKSDQDAFERIFIAYHSRIKTFIQALVKSGADAEDLTQDIFAKLWINRETIDTQKSFNAYMYTVARNAAFNYLKHKTAGNKYLDNLAYTEADNHTEEVIYAREIALLMDAAVSQMPEQRAKIYRMSRNDGLTNDEIAEKLAISKKTVENQISLALKELRKVIAAFTMFFA